jgi:hypothetical protein
MALVDTGRRTELLYDFYSGRLADWGGEPYGRKVDPGRFWQWAVKRMGYSIISLAQGDFFQKTRSTGVRRFSISRATSSQNSSRLSPSQLLGAPSLGTLIFESFPWWGSDARSAGEGIWAPFLALLAFDRRSQLNGPGY